jgi:hypothetical protein
VLEPSKRPTLEQIQQSSFLCDEANIPKNLPLSSIAVKPSEAQLKQFSSTANSQR